MSTRIILATCMLLTANTLWAQQRCATEEYTAQRLQQNPKLERKQQFEQWITQRLDQKKELRQSNREASTQALYQIPVVVHIIHNGEPIGVGTNISDTQILSQIQVLNKDFQRLNTDASGTPSEFLPVAASLDIEFVLAKQDPYGSATNGILRARGTQSTWTRAEDVTLKAHSYWPAEDYFNIWVTNIPSYLGYAQFPVSSLPGLEDSPDDALTDGIVVHYTAFGSNYEGLGTFTLDTQFDRGRTATHEAGHFFGLRHIWGDTNCGTDYVDDTPVQTTETNGCPAHPANTTCGGIPRAKMFQNYMDYSNDVCMNLYTQGQVARMVVVLENSPRRFSLLNSDGDESPPTLAHDVAISNIEQPGSTFCGGQLTPKIEIKNIGTTQATSVIIEFRTNGSLTESKTVSVNLATLEATNVTFNPITQPSGTVTYEFNVITVNGNTDQRPENDLVQISTTIPAETSIPFAEVFNAFPALWTTQNPDNGKTWQYRTLPSGGQKALYVNCYLYENEGATDLLVTPILDLTNATAASFKFDYAYAQYSSLIQERMRVLVSQVCDFGYSPVEVFNKSGNQLATAPQTTSPFSPETTEWVTETISLSAFIGSKIQIAFEVTNAYGNNVYLDNVIVETDDVIDLAILTLESPGPVTCVSVPSPVVAVKNMGSLPINSFTITPNVNSIDKTPQVITLPQPLLPGTETSVTLTGITLNEGTNSLQFTVSSPNGLTDAYSNNNQLINTRIVNQAEDMIPLRQNFNDSFINTWSVVSQNNETTWQSSATNKVFSMSYNAFTIPERGEESWLVSPVLNFSNSLKASLFFDISYAAQSNGDERLRVLYSEDCGQTYPFVLYDYSGSSLATTTNESPWLPSQASDWRKEFINLNALAGKENIRIAFVSTSDKGNNLYVDNVEFFANDDPFPVSVEDTYSVYSGGETFSITFNLPERQTVQVAVYSITGSVMLNREFPETLNQTYTFDLNQQGSGIYIVKVQMGNLAGASKVFLAGK